ncbi:MAG TPA: ATP-binding protein [Solirubrobacterales bacterium]|nr:ATP-binding protein [Solirubrobacterales bacterium]
MLAGNERSSRIGQAIREVASGAEPKVAAKRLLEALAGDGEIARASIYFLDLSEARFELFVHHGKEPEQSSISLAAAGVSHASLTPSVIGRQANGPLGQDWLPIVRKDTMIGLLNISSDEVGFDKAFDAPVDILSAVFAWLYEQHFAWRLLGELQKPIPYEGDEGWFLADLLNVIRLSSGMAYAAVREHTADDTLRCLAVRGFEEEAVESAPSEKLTFRNIREKYPAFAEAIETGEVIPELDMRLPRNQFLQDHPALKDVQSYIVAPIKVGSETLGTLSLATKAKYPFTPFELQGFESIANGVGIAITNFRNHHEMVERFGDVAVAVSAIEIATAVRHATASILERSWFWLGKVKEELGKPSPDPGKELGELETELQLLSEQLQKFKVATERPERELEPVLLKERWEYAEDALAGRIANLGIETRYEGQELEIIGYGDWIGHLFLNLMLNSMDAFEQVKRKGDRKIRLRVDQADGAGNITALYSDNATGIIGTKLVGGPPRLEEVPVKQRIFEAHVTSKRDPEAGYKAKPGAGLGLFLVRKVMDDHGGSIDLLESREGARFRLLFPRQLIENKSR